MDPNGAALILRIHIARLVLRGSRCCISLALSADVTLYVCFQDNLFYFYCFRCCISPKKGKKIFPHLVGIVYAPSSCFMHIGYLDIIAFISVIGCSFSCIYLKVKSVKCLLTILF